MIGTKKNFPTATLAIAFASLAMSGCQTATPLAPANVEQSALEGQVSGPSGRVTVDLRAIEASLSGRKLLGFGDSTITHYRLTASGLDFPSVSTTVQAGSVATISLAVPVGKNRIFRLQALQDDTGTPAASTAIAAGNELTHIISEIASIGEVATSGTTTIDMDYSTNAAARTMSAIFDGLKKDFGLANGGTGTYYGSTPSIVVGTQLQTNQFDASLGLDTLDYSTLLKSYVSSIVGYDKTANTYSRVNPLLFKSQTLFRVIKNDWNSSLAMMNAGLPIPALIEAANTSLSIPFNFPLAGSTSQPNPYAVVQLFSNLNHQTITAGPTDSYPGSIFGTAKFSNVPAGTWWLKFSGPHIKYTYWRKIVVTEGGLNTYPSLTVTTSETEAIQPASVTPLL